MSNYTKATNFTAKDGLPTGNSGKIVKGAEIDTELTAVASAISSKADLNSPALTGTPTAPTASASTNTTQLATTAFVQTALASAFTSGMIMMWSGTIATIPTGWVLCNGSNSTPDLRNRFVIGAHSDNTGVANTTVTGGNTLTGGTADAVVVTHTHTATSTDSGHTHGFTASVTNSSTPTGPGGAGGPVGAGTTATGNAVITTTVASAGVSGTNQNLPPYYALAYIMKT
jgi:microcystin-dependent protein